MKYIVTFLVTFITTPVLADCVVLLHGLARSSTSFVVMEQALQGIGYDVVNVDYPSTEAKIQELSQSAIDPAVAQCSTDADMHFVTHSMGGILIRYYLSKPDQRPKNLGHVVMLAPPNKGSAVVDQLGALPGFELWNGIAGKQLGTGANSLPNRLGRVDYSLGIIAGKQSISPIFSKMIEGDDDGKVSVRSTKVAGMTDHIILPVTHTFMMNSPSVFRQVAHYLREGAFKHDLQK